MITIPVTVGFNFNEKDIIGSITIDENRLPSSPEYVFSLGYKYTGKAKYTLVCVSLTSDNEYLQYLQQKDINE